MVVSIIAIFSLVVLFSIGDNTKSVIELKAVEVNMETLQAAVDFYKLYNEEYPTEIQPTETIPQEIDMSLLVPKYMRELPKGKNLKYWVDYRGKIWASSIRNPMNVVNDKGTITWLPVEGAKYYNVYELKEIRDEILSFVKAHKVTLVKKLSAEEVGINPLYQGESNKIYLISAIDSNGFESAPIGEAVDIKIEYPEQEERPEIKVKPVAVIKDYDGKFTINAPIKWECGSFHPQGYKIVNREWVGIQDYYLEEGIYTIKLRVQDEKGTWSDWTQKRFYMSGNATIKDIDSGFSHSLFIKKDNSLWGFGSNEYGQLGVSQNVGGVIQEPIKIMDNVESVSAGRYHTLVKRLDGSLWTFGNNYYGQLGHSENAGINKSNHKPKQIFFNVKSIVAGENHSLVIKENNEAWGFGSNEYGQLGLKDCDGGFNPQFIMDNVREIDTNVNHTLFVKTNNTLWGTGNNHDHQFTDVTGNRGQKAVAPPVLIMNNVKTAKAGENYSLIIKTNGTAMSVGGNKYGQLGIKKNSGEGNPVANFEKIMDDAKRIEAGRIHSFIIKNDDSLWSFGSNQFGQIGLDNYNSNNDTPTKIMDGVLKVVAGENHSLVLKKDYSLWVMGRNDEGQLGTPEVLGHTKKPIKIYPK